MGQQYSDITGRPGTFVGDRKIFFVGTAATDSRLNTPPNGVQPFEHAGEREELSNQAIKKGEQGLRDYRHDKNRPSINRMHADFASWNG